MARSATYFSFIESRLFANRLYAAVVVLLFASFAFQLWYHATRTSATIDEPVHILAGHRHWQCGDFGINPEHPPLLKLLATAPLNFRTLVEPNWDCGSRLTSKPDSYSFGNLFLVQNGVDTVVIPARLAAAILSLLLAVLVFLAAWEMFGRWEALTALALLAFEPNLIAHGSIVTTDMVLTATAFAAVYALYRFRNKASWVRFLIVGVAFGLLLAAKHSAVILVPILFGLLIADVVIFRHTETRLPLRILRQTAAFAGMFFIGLMLLWTFYGFRYYSIPGATSGTVSIADYIKENGRPETIESFSAKMTEGISRTHIFPESYVLGMADIVATASRNSFIFGRNYATGQWFYFPVAFAVKSSVALLLLLPIGLLFPFFNRDKRREMMFLLVPPLAFFAVCLTSKFTTGIRHILPVYGFFIVAAAVGAVWLSRKFYLFRYVLIALLIFHAVAAFRTAPNYLAFSNDFWGGTNNTYRILAHSNVDTGQSVKLVNEYLARENIGECWFAAYVHPELIHATQPCRVLPSGFRVLVSQSLIEPVPPVIEGTVLVSVNELPPRGGNEYLPIAQSRPIAQIGGNIFVYRGRFEIPLLAAISHTHRAGQFLRLNQVNEAVAEGRKAIELAAGDPRTHLSLGLALSRASQKEEARREFEQTIELSKSDPVFRNIELRAQQELRRLG
jgi:4-amino-4-deoxy-L-arabinose transferase-like glycosyltransferase